MEPNFYRKKLLNAILYFSKIRNPNKTNICKLLHWFDFEHFRQTGYPAIGLEYFSFKWGPVPKSFWIEIKDGNIPDDFKGKLSINIKENDRDRKYNEFQFVAKAKPDISIFTPRELEIMKDLFFIFKNVEAWEISKISHERNKPWDVTVRQKGYNKPIDYMLAIDDKSEIDQEFAKETLKNYIEVLKNFKLEPTE